jgi:hypothetical protein
MPLRRLIVALAFASAAFIAISLVATRPSEADPPVDPKACQACCDQRIVEKSDRGPCMSSCMREQPGICTPPIPAIEHKPGNGSRP